MLQSVCNETLTTALYGKLPVSARSVFRQREPIGGALSLSIRGEYTC